MGAADQFFQKAEQALKKRGSLDYAIELFQQGLQIDPNRLEERRKLRNAEVRRCQENGGNTLGGTAIMLRKALHVTNIRKLGMQKKWEEQIIEIEKFLVEAPQNPDMNMRLALAFEATERLPSSIWAYNTVVEVDPKNFEALKALGRLYAREKDIERAIACWERVRAVRPEDQDAGKSIRDLSASMMMAKAEARRAESSDGSFRDLLKDVDEAAKLQKKGALIRTEDDAHSAIDIKMEEIEKEPQNSRLWRDLGDLYMKHLRAFDKAKECYEKARAIDPHDLFVPERLGKLQEEIFENEIFLAEQKLRESAGGAEAEARLAEARKSQSLFLLEEYQRRVAAHPTDYGLKFKYGDMLRIAGRNDEAIAQFQQARKDPKFAVNSQYRIGNCFFAKKLYDLAISQYSAALVGISEADSDLAKSVRYDLAEVHAAKGEPEKALDYYEQIMAVDINYQDVSKKVDKIRGM